MQDIGVIIGRFQVHQLHDAHKNLINTVAANHKRVILFLGVSPTLVTKKNPLDFVTRKEMVHQEFPDLTILALPDFPSDRDWGNELDRRIREACPMGSVLLYGGRDSFINYYQGSFQTHELDGMANFSGTEVRKEVSQEVKASQDFRAGVIFAAYNQYPKVFATVDVAIVRGKELLLGRKANEDLFRFIGGFTDPTDDCYEDAAKREAFEETGLEIGQPRYIGSKKIDDWRYRNEVDKIITHLFVADYVFGNPQAQDDIAELRWFDIDKITPEMAVAQHRVLLEMFLGTTNR